MKINIGFTGDFCPWLRMESAFQDGSWKEKLANVQGFFLENDLNILDLECPLTEPKGPIYKTGPHIYSNPETAVILNYLNCNLVATANNHMMDYGVNGLKRTYDTLKKHNIEWFGSGLNNQEATKVMRREIKGVKFSFINFTENEWSTTTDLAPGCNPLDPVALFNQIQEAKIESDFVIVIAHGGHEHYPLPSPRIKKLYRYLVDAGAHAVIAHHTHIISGFEKYKGAPIFYSLGNFCFDWEGMRNGTWNKGMIVRLSFEVGREIGFENRFVHHNDDFSGVKFVEESEFEVCQSEFLRLSEIIANDNELKEQFNVFLENRAKVMQTLIEPYQGKLLPGMHMKGLIPNLHSKSKKRLLANLIRCESHRDVLLASFEILNKSGK